MASRKQGIPLRKRPSVSRQGTSRQRKVAVPAEIKRAFQDSEKTPLINAFVIDGRAIDAGVVAGSFGISKSQLAETIGIGREAFYKQARNAAPKTQTRLREMLEILSRVSDWAGGKERAMAWYRAQPISAFGGRTPESLVKSGNAAALRDYLDHIALGGYA